MAATIAHAGPSVPWDTLLQNLNSKIDATPAKRDADYPPLVGALDVLLDEIKSGESFSGYESKIVGCWKRLFIYPNWNLIQTVFYGLCHLFRNKSILPVLTELHGDQGSQSITLLSHLVSHLSDDKREIKEAAAQALGTLSATFGDALFALGTPPLLETLLKNASRVPQSSDNETIWESLEGHMMALGYAVAKCPDISQQNLAAILNVIFTCTTHSFPYANYVRQQALKALGRIVTSPHVRAQFAQKREEYETRVQTILFARLDDEDIDVRKSAARLFECWAMYQAAESKEARSLQNLLAAALKSLESAGRWEQRHGICFAIGRFANPQANLVKLLDWPSVDSLFQALHTQIRHTHPESPSVAFNVRCGANSAAAVALTNLFLSLFKHLPVSAPALTKVFEDRLSDDIRWLLSASEPALIDAGGVVLQQLVFFHPEFARPYLPRFLCLVFKNKFHASLPIRDSSIRNWRYATVQGAANHEADMLLSIREELLNTLFADAHNANPEVRETVFKALEEFFAKVGKQAAIAEDETLALRLIKACFTAAADTTGANSEYPRVAAINALSKWATGASAAIQKNATVLAALVGAPVSSAAASTPAADSSSFSFGTRVCGWLADDFENFVVATLNFLSTLRKTWSLDSQLYLPLASPLLCLSHSALDSIEVPAQICFSTLYGDLASSLSASSAIAPALFAAMAHGFTGRFGFALDKAAEEEDRQRNARAIRYLLVEAQPSAAACASSPAAVALLQTLADALLVEENLSDMQVQAHSLAALLALLSRAPPAALQPASGLVALLSSFLIQVCVLGKDEFDYAAEVIQLKRPYQFPRAKAAAAAAAVDDETDDGDEDDDDVEIKPIKTAKAELWLCTRLLTATAALNRACACLAASPASAADVTSVAASLERALKLFVKSTPAAVNCVSLAVSALQPPMLTASLAKLRVDIVPTIDPGTAFNQMRQAVATPKAWEGLPYDTRWAIAVGVVASLTPQVIPTLDGPTQKGMYDMFLDAARRNPENAARERRLRGLLVQPLGGLAAAMVPQGFPLGLHLESLQTLLQPAAALKPDEADDEDPHRRLLLGLEGKLLTFGEYSLYFVRSAVVAAFSAAWTAAPAPARAALVDGVALQLGQLGQHKHASQLLTLLKGILPAAEAAPKLLAAASAAIKVSQDDDDLEDDILLEVTELCLAVAQSAPELASPARAHFLALLKEKPFLSRAEGRPAVHLLHTAVLLSPSLASAHAATEGPHHNGGIEATVAQLLVDLLANEDLEDRRSLFSLLQRLHPLRLPAVSAPTGPINETFAKAQSH